MDTERTPVPGSDTATAAGAVGGAEGSAEGCAERPGGANTVLSTLTRWVLVLHAALLAAQPFLAGAMLDAMSPEPQTMHRMVAMTVVTVGLAQVLLTLAAWKGRSAWPQRAFLGSLVLWIAELVQFTLGHLSLAMSVHVPLGIASLAGGVYLAVRYGRARARR